MIVVKNGLSLSLDEEITVKMSTIICFVMDKSIPFHWADGRQTFVSKE